MARLAVTVHAVARATPLRVLVRLFRHRFAAREHLLFG